MPRFVVCLPISALLTNEADCALLRKFQYKIRIPSTTTQAWSMAGERNAGSVFIMVNYVKIKRKDTFLQDVLRHFSFLFHNILWLLSHMI